MKTSTKYINCYLKDYYNNNKFNIDYLNEITDTLNEYLKPKLKQIIKMYDKSLGTYLSLWPKDKEHIALRVPGATRGHITVKDNIIIEFTFYDTAEDCYEGDYKSAINKYIGSKLIFITRLWDK